MRWVRAQMAEASRASRRQEKHRPDFVDGTIGADGLIYSRDTRINEELMEADKTAMAMPDIVKTLEGRR